MKAKKRLILGFRIALPVSINDGLMEHLYQKSLKPLIQLLYHQPQLPVLLYIPGQFLKYMEKNHIESFDVIAEMVQRRSIEILGGGMYEPLVSLIPRGDSIDQFEYMTTYIRQHFGKRPRGFWLPGDIWHAPLIALLKRSGLMYTVIDKEFLSPRRATHKKQDGSIYVTEYEGATVFLFPRHSTLERHMFHESVDIFMQRLLAVSHAGAAPIVLCPEITEFIRLEQFASWLEDFFRMMQGAEYDIYATFPQHYLAKQTHFYDVHIPNFGLEKLLSSDVADINNNSRLLLAHIPENKLLYARMQYIHILRTHLRNDKSRRKTAQEVSWPAQSCYAYSSLPDGGVQINMHRKQSYASLIDAERIIREHNNFKPSLVTMDYDFDGLEESMYSGYDMNAYVHRRGATLFELDWFQTNWNYLDTFQRSPGTEAANPPDHLHYDTYPRSCFVDHFLSSSETLNRFVNGSFVEQGNFVDVPYTQTRIEKNKKVASYTCEGIIQQEGRAVRTGIEKTYTFLRNTIRIQYRITTQQRVDNLLFAPELNFSFASSDNKSLQLVNDDGVVLSTGRRRRISSCKTVRFLDLKNNVSITCLLGDASFVWSFPVHSWGNYRGRAEELYQFSCLLPCWKISAKRGEVLHYELALKIEKYKG